MTIHLAPHRMHPYDEHMPVAQTAPAPATTEWIVTFMHESDVSADCWTGFADEDAAYDFAVSSVPENHRWEIVSSDDTPCVY